MTPAGAGEVSIIRATLDDLGFIMATERLPGYEALVASSDEATHHARLANPRAAHFLAIADNRPAGFAILRDWNSPDGITLLMRIAMARPGRGQGTAFLRLLIDQVFTATACHRLWVGQFPDNARARHVYQSVGFVPEGIARGNVFLHGRHHDELILAILRPEWEARRSG